MNPPNSAAIINRINSFPTLPSIVAQVMQVIADPQSSARDLSEVIIADPAMTAMILKIANSPFFGLPKKVASLQHAIAIIGFSEIRNLVLARSICQSFKTLPKNAKFDMRRFWNHSFLCGLAAKIIAADFKPGNIEFFVAGLIHDIGKLVLYMVHPQEFCRLSMEDKMGGPQLRVAEKAAFGFAHDEAGMRLVKRWLLPTTLVAGVGFHHQPYNAKDHPVHALVVHLADLLARLNETKEENIDVSGLRESFFQDDTLVLAQSCGLELTPAVLSKFEHSLDMHAKEDASLFQMLAD